MNGITSRPLRGVQKSHNRQVAFGGAGRPDQVGLVGQPDVGGETIGLRVYRHRLDAQLAAGADDAHRDLTPIGDQDFLDHQRGILPCFRGGPGSRLLRIMRNDAISRGRVSRGSMTSSR